MAIPDPASASPSLVELARQWSQHLFAKRQDNRYVYHHAARAAQVAEQATQLGTQVALSAHTVSLACAGAYLHPLGYLLDEHQPELARQQDIHRFVRHHGLTSDTEQQLLQLFGAEPATEAACLLRDATTVQWLSSFVEQSELAKLERELLHGQPLDRLEWGRWQMQELLRTRFYILGIQPIYQPLLSHTILEQHNRLEKWTRASPAPPAVAPPFATIEGTDPPVRAAQTYFRAIYRNHINLSAIADNKANIMISVNAILISVLITFLSYRNWAETRPIIMLPVVLFLVTGLTSLVCAVLSARPRVSRPGGQPRNLAFFGHFTDLDEDTFLADMDSLLNQGDQLYGTMVRDLYYLGKVLDRKYHFLSLAYTIFMVGLIATVITFLVTLFLR